jgi:hypothetical protein
MFNETIVPNEQQNCFVFPKDWYGKMNVQIIATPIPEKQPHEDDPEELQRRQAFRQHMNELHRKAKEAMSQKDPVARKLDLTTDSSSKCESKIGGANFCPQAEPIFTVLC